jgi:hypothetical protein
VKFRSKVKSTDRLSGFLTKGYNSTYRINLPACGMANPEFSMPDERLPLHSCRVEFCAGGGRYLSFPVSYQKSYISLQDLTRMLSMMA